MTKVRDVLAMAWMVRVLRREFRRDQELTGTVRVAVKAAIDSFDTMRELMAIAVSRRRAKAPQKG